MQTNPARLAPVLLLASSLAACLEPTSSPASPPAEPTGGARGAALLAAPAPERHDVMESVFCARCHPDAYAEHEQSTHGRAFTDEEVRLATARFAHQD